MFHECSLLGPEKAFAKISIGGKNSETTSCQRNSLTERVLKNGRKFSKIFSNKTRRFRSLIMICSHLFNCLMMPHLELITSFFWYFSMLMVARTTDACVRLGTLGWTARLLSVTKFTFRADGPCE